MSVAIYTYSARSTAAAHERQQHECQTLADRLGLTVTRVYGDGNGARHALARLLADTARGDVSAVIIASVDRLGRSVGTVSRIVAQFHETGVIVYTARQGPDPIANRPAHPDS